MKENAVAVVADIRFLKRHFKKFFKNLVSNGKYIGDLLIITSRFSPTFLIKDIRKNKNIKIILLKKIRFPKKVKKSYLSLNTGNRPNRFKTKNFQWFKLNLFNPELKKWKNTKNTVLLFYWFFLGCSCCSWFVLIFYWFFIGFFTREGFPNIQCKFP